MNETVELNLQFLSRLTQSVGIIEHSNGDQPAPKFGYCTDDAGRLLAVISLLPRSVEQYQLSSVALRFLEDAFIPRMGFRIRRGANGEWTDDPLSDDATGRAIQGLGVSVAVSPWLSVRSGALQLFESVDEWRTPYPRALSHAVLGAVSVLKAFPAHAGALDLVAYASAHLPTEWENDDWRWPEPRLAYGNALLAEALLAISYLRGDQKGVDHALDLLEWLVEAESLDGHFSFTPTSGRSLDQAKPSFDQQPIEAWAMADACARAFMISRETKWAERVRSTRAWFFGDNDLGVPMCDESTGGGFDGLESSGVNRNQGAESTLAYLGTMVRHWEIEHALHQDLRFLDDDFGVLRESPFEGHTSK